ncbi:MAG: hypothetical protein L0229_16945 [Blastocatellia bacterium]|nr:hypothetical protein [Blastocatellia bacterium]
MRTSSITIFAIVCWTLTISIHDTHCITTLDEVSENAPRIFRRRPLNRTTQD